MSYVQNRHIKVICCNFGPNNFLKGFNSRPFRSLAHHGSDWCQRSTAHHALFLCVEDEYWENCEEFLNEPIAWKMSAEEMEKELICTLEGLLAKMSGPASNPPTHLPPPATEPVDLGFYPPHQQVGGQGRGYNGFIPMGDNLGPPRPIMPNSSMYNGPVGPPPVMTTTNMYNRPVGQQYWDQPRPMMAGPSMYTGPVPQQFWDQPRPMMAGPGMYNEPVHQQYWEQLQPMMFGPIMYSHVMQPDHLTTPVGAQTQQQFQPWPCPPQTAAGVAAAAVSHPNENAHGMTLPEAMNLKPVGFLNGELVYELPGPYSDATPQNVFMIDEKRKDEDQQDGERPYVKRPPNAFMLFMKEQRPKVVAECNITNNADVNVILGQRWKSLTQEEQAPYFERAEEERQLHKHQHPDWSCRDNFGIKRKRVRGATVARITAFASEPAEDIEDTQQTKTMSVTSVQSLMLQTERCLSPSVSLLDVPTPTKTFPAPQTLTTTTESRQYLTIGEELLQMMVHVRFSPAALSQSQMKKSIQSLSDDDEWLDEDDESASDDDDSFTDEDELADKLLQMLE